MNNVVVNGKISDIEYSHSISDNDYYKGILTTSELKFPVKFKLINFPINLQNTQVSLKGTLRSYSYKLNKNKNKVEVYIFTDFKDLTPLDDSTVIDGRICKINSLKEINGQKVIHFILANNIITPKGIKINNYIPCVAFDTEALKLSSFEISDKILIEGHLNSRSYVVQENSIEHTNTAYELIVD